MIRRGTQGFRGPREAGPSADGGPTTRRGSCPELLARNFCGYLYVVVACVVYLVYTEFIYIYVYIYICIIQYARIYIYIYIYVFAYCLLGFLFLIILDILWEGHREEHREEHTAGQDLPSDEPAPRLSLPGRLKTAWVLAECGTAGPLPHALSRVLLFLCRIKCRIWWEFGKERWKGDRANRRGRESEARGPREAELRRNSERTWPPAHPIEESLQEGGGGMGVLGCVQTKDSSRNCGDKKNKNLNLHLLLSTGMRNLDENWHEEVSNV